MPKEYPARLDPSTPRTNQLHIKKTDSERCQAVWDDLPAFAQYLDQHNMSEEEMASVILFVETVAEQMVHRKTTINSVTHDFIEGHHWLNQYVNPHLLEQMEALELIARPTIYNRQSPETKRTIARRVLWGLGETSKEFLDMEFVRGYARVKRNPGPHVHSGDVRDMRGDPNESIVHQYIVRAGELYYRHVKRHSAVRTYVRLGDLIDVEEDVANRRLDLVALDKDENVVATGEAELLPSRSEGVVRDAQAMAMLPGDSDWFVFAKQQVNDLLDTLDGHVIQRPDSIPGWSKRDTARTEAMKRVKRIIKHPEGSVAAHTSPAVTDVNTIDNLRALLNQHHPQVFKEMDPRDLVWQGGEDE